MSRTHPRRRRLSSVFAPVLVAVIAAAGAVAMGSSSPVGAQQRHAVIVSDSILLGAQAPLTSRLQGAGWSVDFDGAVSRSTLSGADAVRSRGASVSDSLVVSLGANDSGNPATFRSRVDAVMAAAANVPHVYWITIREVRPYYAPANQVLRDAATRYRNLTIVDWNAASAGRSGLTASDGLHLTPAGANELAGLVAGAVMTQTPGPATPVSASPATTPTVAAGPVPAAVPSPPQSAAPTPTPPPELAPVLPAAAPVPDAAPPAGVVALGEGAAAATGFDWAALHRPTPLTAAAEPGVSAPGSTSSGGVSAGSGLSAGWLVACLLGAAVGGFAVARRSPWMPFALRSASVPIRRSGVTRSEMRAARIAKSQGRHPSVAEVTPVPEYVQSEYVQSEYVQSEYAQPEQLQPRAIAVRDDVGRGGVNPQDWPHRTYES